MIEDDQEPMEDAAGINDVNGQQSSHAIEPCSREASDDCLGDDPGPLGVPAGFATSAIDAFPSPAPAVSMTLEMYEKPSPRRSKPNVLPTDLLHSEAGDHGLTPCGSSKNRRSAHLSTDRCVRSSMGYRTEFNASASAGARYPLP